MSEADGWPARVHVMETALTEVRGELAAQKDHNARLISTLRDAREQIVTLKSEVDRLGEPPSGFATLLRRYEDGTADIVSAGRKLRVALSPTLDVERLMPGQEVMLNESLNVIDALAFEDTGEIVIFKEFLDDGERALVLGHTDEERVVRIAQPLREQRVRAGDSLLCDVRAGYVFERIPKSEVEELVLEEVPDIRYEDIGVNLTVTPKIGLDGFVRLELGTTNSSLGSSNVEINKSATVPIINNRRANTTVSVQSGQTIIIGGLIGTQEDRRERKVPFFGDIPYLGAAFRSTKITKEKRELLIFLTPQVLANVQTPVPLTEPADSLREQLERSRLNEELKRNDFNKPLLDPIFPPSPATPSGPSGRKGTGS